ncbi:MAG: DsbC family protein [Deltaproteobacteria bacterium]|nr:DsbC family protein [Deltaproteobacteria bacterium]
MVKPFFPILAACALLLCASGAHAFQKDGCGTGECVDCHTLDRGEADKILGGMVDNVLNVEMSPVQGLWVVDIQKGGKKFPIYIDFSRNFLISGQVVRLSTKEDITGTRFEALNAVTVDLSEIPIDDALVVGNPAAGRKVVVFSDPDCHFCGKLHEEMKIVVGKDPDVAFCIKLYSRSNNPAVNEKAKAVICSRSLAMLEDAYAGKPIPPPGCNTGATDETFNLAEKLNIRGTPALVLPDGRIVGGYRTADALLKLLAEMKTAGGGMKTPEKDKGKK